MKTIALVDIDNEKKAKSVYEQLLNKDAEIHWYTYQKDSGLDLDLEIKDLREAYDKVIIIRSED